MSSESHSDTKYVIRRLGFLGVLLLIAAALAIRPTIANILYDIANPPPPEPAIVQRMERTTENCWDILALRNDEELDAFVITIMGGDCKIDADRFNFVIDIMEDIFASQYQGETYFVTEWVTQEGPDYFITSITICNGLEVATVGLRGAQCPSQAVRKSVSSRTVRRWWISDFTKAPVDQS